MKYLLTAALLLTASYASAFDGQTFFPNANSRVTQQGTDVRGYNPQTGRSWFGTADNQGNVRTHNSQGQLEQYNAETGRYHNYSTGKQCFGRGPAQTCF